MWDSDSPDLEPKAGPPLYLTEIISKAIVKMKTGKAAGSSGIVIEMIRSAGKEIIYKPCKQNFQGHIPSD